MRLLRHRRTLGLALACALVAPASVLATAAPASAAGCTGSDGVTVVVDYNGLGGRRTVQGCASGAGGNAWDLFTAVGTQMRESTRERGFVCRVNGLAPDDPCVNASPADAYWALFFSDGSQAQWSYATTGVRSLSVPSGGMVAWSWQGSTSEVPPEVSPTRTVQEPPGGGSGRPGGSGGGSGGSNGGGTTSPGDDPSSSGPSSSPDRDPGASEGAAEDLTAGSGAASEGEDEQGKARKSAKKGPKDEAGTKKGRENKDGKGAREGGGESVDSPLTDEDGDTEQVSSASEEDPAGLPVWVPIAVLVVLAAGGVGAVVWRRRTGGTA